MQPSTATNTRFGKMILQEGEYAPSRRIMSKKPPDVWYNLRLCIDFPIVKPITMVSKISIANECNMLPGRCPIIRADREMDKWETRTKRDFIAKLLSMWASGKFYFHKLSVHQCVVGFSYIDWHTIPVIGTNIPTQKRISNTRRFRSQMAYVRSPRTTDMNDRQHP